MLKKNHLICFLIIVLAIGQLTCSVAPTSAPHFKPGFNLFTPEQDIQVGKQSAAQVEHQAPLINDPEVAGYIDQLGRKLAAQAPGFKYPYEFHVVATKDINAFALPGGFVFVNAGAILAAKNEGELAGVMAHEISHVALRHGTNQATKAYLAKRGLGVVTGIFGGNDSDLGQVVEAIGGLGANVAFLKFSRTAETQADLEGVQIMAAAGYDPHDMADFFKTLESQSGERAPQFLSDHPDPGNRVQAINDEIPTLKLSSNPIHDTPEFDKVKAKLTAQAGSMASAAGARRVGPTDPNDNHPETRPEPPSSTFSDFESPNKDFAFRYPANWDALAPKNEQPGVTNLIFAPKGAYGTLDNNLVVTHGLFVGGVPPKAADLNSATRNFVQEQLDQNADFRIIREPQPTELSGRSGFVTVVAGPSPVTGVVEEDAIYTVLMGDGRLFYLITITPETEKQSYEPAFRTVIASIKIEK